MHHVNTIIDSAIRKLTNTHDLFSLSLTLQELNPQLKRQKEEKNVHANPRHSRN